MENEVTFTKSPAAETYTLRWTKKSWWAVITIDTSNGIFMVMSDFGSYNYRWGSPGKSFKEFLIGLEKDPSYLLKKISSMEFDPEGTLKQFIADAKKGRDDETISPLQYEEIEAIIFKLQHGGNSSHEYQAALMNSDAVGTLYGYDLSCYASCQRYPYEAKAFVEHIYPEFVRILKDEISAPKLTLEPA